MIFDRPPVNLLHFNCLFSRLLINLPQDSSVNVLRILWCLQNNLDVLILNYGLNLQPREQRLFDHFILSF